MFIKSYSILFSILLCVFCNVSFAQQFDIEFQECFGGSGGDVSVDMKMLADSSFIILGLTTSHDGDISFNHGEGDFWLVKTNKFGELIWEKTYGGSDSESPTNLAITSTGDYILFGDTQSNDGDVSGNHGGFDYWVLKTDSQGNLLWQRCLGSSVNDLAYQMRLDDEDNIYVIGESHGDDGDISDPCNFIDYWIAKLNTNGDLLWDRTLGGTNIDWGKAILPTLDGGYIAGGYTTSTDGDVSCTEPSLDQSDAWIVKLDSNNNIEWDQCYGGSYNETVYDIVETEDDGYLIVGNTNSNDGDVSGLHGSPGGEAYDIWVWKIDSTGNLEWQNCFGGTKEEGGARITGAGEEEFIINGYTTSNDGDVSGNHSSHYSDIWLLKFEQEGELLWQQCFGSSNGEATAGICLLNDIEIMVASGTFKSDGSVDCDLFHPGFPMDADFWLFKIVDTVTVALDEYQLAPETIIIYPNPADDLIYYYSRYIIGQSRLVVYDIFGRVMGGFSFPENQNQIEIDVSQFFSGVYLAVLYSDHKIIDRRQFVVK